MSLTAELNNIQEQGMAAYSMPIPIKVACTLLLITAGYSAIKVVRGRAAMYYYHEGMELLANGRYIEAISSLRTSISLKPEFSSSHIYLGYSYYHAGQVGNAIPEFQHALEITPNYPAAYYYLGGALNDTGRRKEARDAWQKVLALPERPWAKSAQEQLDKYPDATR